MADIITNQVPPFVSDGAASPAPLKQRWVDRTTYHALKVSLVLSAHTPAAGTILSHQSPPFLSDGASPPAPVKQRWVDIGGGAYARFVVLERV